MLTANFLVITSFAIAVQCQVKNIVLTNDDGWAVAQIRAQNDALKAAGFSVVLSAPTQNESGTGSSSATPGPLTQPCEFNTCPTGSPAEGFNASDPRLNWVNSFPVDSVRFGIQTLGPKFFGGPPQLVVAGPNVGNNLGTVVLNSGTVGAACEAAKEGIPSIAFSGQSNSQVSFTTLESDPNSLATIAALVNSQLTVKFVNALLSGETGTIVPANTTINVNTSGVSGCTDPDDFEFIFARNLANPSATDVAACGTTHLPAESAVISAGGCHASVSVINAVTKTDVDAATQAVVFNRVQGILSCL
ncbi:sure-like protein [Irpex rosettiformis]|uniref:Sure-like protein n=1 Tax=Irpex rosettiformis TaxID=378272 RepID=A0ACB8TUC4_9APHY|nr:sure-like protein [Irpex rosettiformis]